MDTEDLGSRESFRPSYMGAMITKLKADIYRTTQQGEEDLQKRIDGLHNDIVNIKLKQKSVQDDLQRTVEVSLQDKWLPPHWRHLRLYNCRGKQ